MNVYGNFRFLNIREFLILGLFLKFTILNIQNLPNLGLTDIVTVLWNDTFQWRLYCNVLPFTAE